MNNLQTFNSNLKSKAQQLKLKENILINLEQNINALKELTVKDGNMLNNILSSNNSVITMFSILNNSINGFVINKDFWLLPFGKNQNRSIVEVKTANAWKQLALNYGVWKFKNIVIQVIFKNDKVKFGIDEYGNNILKDLEIDIEQDRTNYNDIKLVVGIVNFEDGSKKTRFYSRSEIDKLKAVSPSGNSQYSPWNNFPVKMIESKITRDLVIREIQLDNIKMYSAGYKLTDDELAFKVDADETITQDYIAPNNDEVKEDVVLLDSNYEQRLLDARNDLKDKIMKDNNLKSTVKSYLDNQSKKWLDLTLTEINNFLDSNDVTDW